MISRKKMFGFSKIKYNFSDLKQLRLERSHLKGKKIGSIKDNQGYLARIMHQHMGRDRCAQMVHAPFSAMYYCRSWLLSKHCTTIIIIIQCVSSFFSLSPPFLKKSCKPVIIERYHVILFCTRVGLCFFYFYLLYFEFFFNFIPQHLVSFNFYIKSGPYYFDY